MTLSIANATPVVGELRLETATPTVKSIAEETEGEPIKTVLLNLTLHSGRRLRVSELLSPTGYTSGLIEAVGDFRQERVGIPMPMLVRVASKLLEIEMRGRGRRLLPRTDVPRHEEQAHEEPPPAPVVAKPPEMRPARIPPLSPAARAHQAPAIRPGTPRGRTTPR
jgi:hypothetical protein